MADEAALLGRDSIALFLAIAAATKAADWPNSLASLALYMRLRRARWILPLLIAVEILLAVLLLSGIGVQVALLATAVLFLVFAVFLALRIASGASEGSCGCFGLALPSRVSLFAVLRNALIGATCMFLALFDPASGLGGVVPIAAVLWLIPPAVSVPIVLMSLGALEAVRSYRLGHYVS